MLSAIKPLSQGRSVRSCRGSAMTELLVLVFPYAILTIGVIVLAHVTLGRQESQKAVFLAAPTPKEQSEAEVREHTFPNQENGERSNFTFSEETDYSPPQDYATEEPVLPYDDASDMHAGLINLSVEVTQRQEIQNGQATTVQEERQTWKGRLLEQHRILPDREQDLATILDGWLTYSRARSEFSFAYGGAPMPLEEEAENDLRGRFELEQGGEAGISCYSATRPLDPLTGEPLSRGLHHDSSGSYFEGGAISFRAMAALNTVPVSDGVGAAQETLFGRSFPEPVLDERLSQSERDSLWDLMNGVDAYPAGTELATEP